MSLCISYDSTFDGFLSVVFEIYRQHLDVGEIRPDRIDAPCDFFLQPFRIETTEESALRLKRAIVKYASSEILDLLDIVFRSEEEGVEMLMLAYLRKLFDAQDPNYGRNPASNEMLPLYTIARSVRREAGGMLGLIRFDKTSDGVYFAEIEPKYDILPLQIGHFRGRFANERWAIYDSRRHYGVYYDGHASMEIHIPDMERVRANTKPDAFVRLWQEYYESISIKERENPKLLRQNLPVRYWKHLPERNVKVTQGVEKYPTNFSMFSKNIVPNGTNNCIFSM